MLNINVKDIFPNITRWPGVGVLDVAGGMRFCYQYLIRREESLSH